ncbi:MAG: sigma-70 family RNA polymerase sigma factor [Pseudomonadota bacterium]
MENFELDVLFYIFFAIKSVSDDKSKTISSRIGVERDVNTGPRQLDTKKNVDIDTKHCPKLERLYRDYAPVLSAQLRKTFGNGPPEPDDLTQQAFQKLIERGDTSDISSVKGFLWTTARNLLFNDKRNHQVRAKYDFELENIFSPGQRDDNATESVLSAREELVIINKTLEKMPEKRRLAFIMHRVDGLPISRVASELGIARSPARRHILRAMEDIQVALVERKLDGSL